MRISDWSSDVCSSDLLVQMVGGDDPASIGFALDAAGHAPHGFETPDMGFGKAFAGGRVVPQMRVDRIAPAIGGGDLGYGAIGGANAAVARFDLHDGIFRYRSEEHTSEIQSLMSNSSSV